VSTPSHQDAQTCDAVFGGAVQIVQRRDGYRFNADSLWLVAASRPHARGRVLDLGAGAGVVGLCLAAAPEVAEVTLVELQPSLAELARQSVLRSSPRCPVQVLESDLRSLPTATLGASADLVVANPPFFAPERARPAADPENDRARRALAGGLDDFIAAAARALTPDGYLVVVYPARFLDHLVSAAAATRLGLRELRFVHAQRSAPARLLLGGLRPGTANDIEVLPPWFERDAAGAETPEALRLRSPQLLTSGARSPVP